jgi:hypothetical protein
MDAEFSIMFRVSVAKIIPDHSAILHHESNSLELSYLSDRVSCNGNKIGKFSRLDRSDAILPAQQFRRARRDSANDIERRHSGVMQIGKYSSARLAPRFPRIEPAHI